MTLPKVAFIIRATAPTLRADVVVSFQRVRGTILQRRTGPRLLRVG